MKKDSGYFS